ncbi:High mobility group protein B1, partial [Zancudomyces culisetae]
MGVKKTHTVATLSAAEASEISQHFSKLSALFEKISKNVVPIAEGPKKVVRDPNAPKKPLSAYILFCNDFREEVKDRQPGLSSQ